MKVLQVNTVCGSGSVGRICMDLYDVCEKNNIEAYIAYGRGKQRDDIKCYKIGNDIDMTEHVLWNFLKGRSGFASVSTTQAFLRYMDELNPDVIHLHNIHGFYLQVELLFEYIKKRNKKVIWTLHDCWPFTGHCAYFDFVACQKWKTGCNNCSIHASAYPYALFCDSTEEVYPRKKKAFCGVKDLTIVTPSHWLAGLVKESFLNEYPVVVIPNGIDLDKFKPAKETAVEARDFIAAQSDKQLEKSGEDIPYVLGVANVWEHRKGLTFFEKLAGELQEELKRNGTIPYKIVLVGLKKKQIRMLSKKYNKEVLKPLGRTQNIEQLAALYADAAVYVNATLEDNFPTTNLEALACGTGVITFRTGGSSESLDESCGIAITKGDYTKLKETIEEVVRTQPFKEEACVKRAQIFDKKKRFMEYVNLFRAKNVKDEKYV